MRNKKTMTLALLAALVVNHAAIAAPKGVVEEKLVALSRTEPAAYEKSRDALLGDKSLVGALGARVSEATWSNETWKTDAIAFILVERQQNKAAFEALRSLEGLDPNVYLQRRRPLPLVGRELIAAQVNPAALLEARLFGSVVRGTPKAMPAHVAKTQVARLRADEERAFSDAVMMALAESGHPSAVPALVDASLHAPDVVARGAALALLGDLALDPRAESTLLAVLEDTRAAEEARVGATVGLGKVRNTRTALVLASAAQLDENLAVRRSAVGALGNAGNRGAHRVLKNDDSAEVRAIVHDALLDVLQHADDDVMREMAVIALVQSGDATLHSRLTDLSSTTKDARVRELAAQSARVLAKGLSRERD
jgi:hypothetical protein